MLAVDAKDLTKTFHSGWFGRRRKEALAGASLEVPRGAIFGLLGPNGAGKTTLLSILATLLLPDSGSATVLGHDVVRDALAIRRRLNMASGNASFVWSLRPAEVLAFYGRLYGLHGRTLRARVAELRDRIAFIKGGRILAEGSPDELKRQIRIGDVVALRLDPAAPAGLADLAGVLQVQTRGDRIECTVDSAEKRLSEILRWLVEQHVVIRDCQVHEPELEEVFVELAR